jgi:hypothetical protein
MSGRLGFFNRSLQDGNQLVEVLIFTPDSPFLLGIITVLVVLHKFKVAGDILGFLVVASIEIDPGCLGRKAQATSSGWASDSRLGWSRLRHLNLTTDVSDRSQEVGVVGNGVVILGGDRDGLGSPVGGVSTTSILLLWSLARDL